MALIYLPQTVDMNPNDDDPNTWSKSKKKRMRQKRKKIEASAVTLNSNGAATGSITDGHRSCNTDNDTQNKRQKVVILETCDAQSSPSHTCTEKTSTKATRTPNEEDRPSKSPKKRKKTKKKQNQKVAMDISPVRNQLSASTMDEQSPNPSNLKEQNQFIIANQSNRTKSKPTPMSTLQKTFFARLTSSRFRELNEELYTQPSAQSFAQFTSNPELFTQYHTGFRRQVAEWPVNPIDVIYKKIIREYKKQKKRQDVVVADFGCGDAKLAERLLRLQSDENGSLVPKPFVNEIKKKKKGSNTGKCPFKVHSFDLVSGGNPLVTPADMTNVPLPDESVDIGVYCLALMGTNVPDFIREGWRVLKFGGMLKVAEVRSRFEACIDEGGKKHSRKSKEETESTKPLMILDDFESLMERCGFHCTNVDQSNKMFLFMDFIKLEGSTGLSKKENFSAKPCIYKRR